MADIIPTTTVHGNLSDISNIPVGNIIMSFDRSLVTDFGKYSMSDYISKLQAMENKGVFIFNTRDDHFLNFYHAYGSDGTNKAQSEIVFEIIDPRNELEQKIISLSSKFMENRKAADTKSIEALQFYVKSLTQQLATKEQIYAEQSGSEQTQKAKFFNTLEKTDELLALLEPLQSELEKLNTLSAEIKQLKLDINQSNESILKLITSLGFLECFIVYGLGDNYNDWSVPVFCTLTGSNYSYTVEGVRKITLIFATSILPWNTFFDKRGYGIRVTANSDDYLDIGVDVPATDVYQAFQNQAIVHSDVKAGLNPYLDGVDLDNIIILTLHRYLQKAMGTENIIILLPNMNILLQGALNEKTLYVEQKYFVINGNIIKSEALQELFTELGFETIQDDILDKDFEELIKTTVILNKAIVEQADSTGLPAGGDPFNGEVVKKLIPVAAVEAYSKARKKVTGNYKFRIYMSSDLNQSFAEPMDNFEVGLQKLSSYPLDYVKFWEHDPKIIKLFNESLPFFCPRPDKPVFIFGHKPLVDLYLYGRKYIENFGLSLNLAVVPQQGEKPSVLPFTEGMLPPYIGEGIPFGKSITQDGILNDLYRREIFNVLYDKPRYTYFDFTNPPSEEETGVSVEQIERQTFIANIPVFKSGYKNSNILSMNIDSNSQYLTILQQLSFVPSFTYLNPFSGKPIQLLTDRANIYKNITKDQLELVLRFFESSDSKLRDALLMQLGAELGIKLPTTNSNPEEVFGALLDIITVGLQKIGPEVVLDPYLENNILAQLFTMTDQLMQLAKKGSVKTLPFFRLSRPTDIMTPVLMYILENRIQGYDSFNPINAAYSGWWSIIGFKHVISNTSLESTFVICQNMSEAKPTTQEAVLQSDLDSTSDNTIFGIIETV